MNKKILLSSLLFLSLTNVEARDTMGVEIGINSHSFDSEKVNMSDTTEVAKQQSNQNINADFFALIDMGEPNGFLIGPYFSVSASNNGENPNNYDGLTDYAPYGAGLLMRYELDDSSVFSNIGFQVKAGYSYAKIGDRDAHGYEAGVGVFYKVNHNWNIGIQARRHQLEYKKSLMPVKAYIDSVGVFFSYDIF